MKKLLALGVASLFSVSAAAYACDKEKQEAKLEKSGKQTAKAETKDGKGAPRPNS
jgi:hypothetical protein